MLGGTLGSLALGRTIPAQRFSTTLLEENGQTWPVETIQALLRSERAFLIGDHKQLKKCEGGQTSMVWICYELDGASWIHAWTVRAGDELSLASECSDAFLRSVLRIYGRKCEKTQVNFLQ